MIDKIYSRKRITIPKMVPKKISKWKAFIFLLIICLLIIIVCSIVASYPILVASCKTAASSKATHIVNEEVQNVMNQYTYTDLIKIEKDAEENITLMQANTALINQMTTTISQNIQSRLDEMPTIMVYLNYGSISGISILKNFGPQFEIELEAAGDIATGLKSEFESVGVNQTLHRIYAEITTSISLLTPIGSFGSDVQTQVLMTEAVIVGNVPDSYYNLEGLTQTDTMEVFE